VLRKRSQSKQIFQKCKVALTVMVQATEQVQQLQQLQQLQQQHQGEEDLQQIKLSSCAPSVTGDDTSEHHDSIVDEELEQALNIVEVTQAKLALLAAAACKAPRHEVPSLLAQRRRLQQDSAYAEAMLLLEERNTLHVATAVDTSLHNEDSVGGGCFRGSDSCLVAATRHVQFCDSSGDTILCVDDESEEGAELERNVDSPTPAYDQPARHQDQVLLRL